MKLTQQEYIDRGGCHCPFCQSDQTDGTSTDFDGAYVFLKITCLDCEETWRDVYTLSGYQEE